MSDRGEEPKAADEGDLGPEVRDLDLSEGAGEDVRGGLTVRKSGKDPQE